MKNQLHLKLLPFLIIVLFVIGCSTSESSKDRSEGEELISDLSDSSIADERGIEYLLPAPSDLMEMVISENVMFNTKLLAPVGLEKKLVISKHQALMLGVYFTDFAYLNLYQKHQQSLEYLNSIQALADNVGIGSLLKDLYLKKVERNLGNVDSLDIIFADFSQTAFGALSATGSNELLSLIALGSGIEGMYIGMSSSDISKGKQALVHSALEQQVVFENYYKNFLAYNHDKPDMKSLVDELDDIYKYFKVSMIQGGKAKVQTDKAGHFAIKDGPKPTIGTEELIELSKRIKSVRNNIIALKY